MSALEERRVRHRAGKVAYRRRRFVVFGLVVSLLVAAAGFGLYRFWNKPLSAALPAPITLDTKRFTMLVMGTDDRPNQPGRSDTMMIGFVDLELGDVKLLSIPRDAYVQIPGHGWDKINASYPLGGVGLVEETVEQLAGLPIDYTVSVDMQGFEEIVDAVDGVDVEILEDMDYEDPYDNPPLKIHLKKGLQHLDGEDALQFVRFRNDAENDWGRMKRQQQFLQALTKAALKPSNLTSLPQLVKLGSQNVTTNLSLKQLTQLAMLGKDKLGADKISGGTLQGDDIWASDGYYLGLHFADMRAKVRELAGITPDEALLARDDRDAVAYRDGLPEGSSLPGGETSESDSGNSGSDWDSAPTDTRTPPATGGASPPRDPDPGDTGPGTQPGDTGPGTKPGDTEPGDTQPDPRPTPEPGPGSGSPPAPAPGPGDDGDATTPPSPTPEPAPGPGPGTGNSGGGTQPDPSPAPPSGTGTSGGTSASPNPAPVTDATTSGT